MHIDPPPPPRSPDLNLCRNVLDATPTPIVVVDTAGLVQYVNRATSQLVGWSASALIGTPMVGHIHPDDVPWIAQTFVDVLDEVAHEPDTATTAWTPITCRVMSAAGTSISVEVTGSGLMLERGGGCVIYTLRPVERDRRIEQILAATASGQPVDAVLEQVMEMVAMFPTELGIAVVEQRDDDTVRVVAATSHELGSVASESASEWERRCVADSTLHIPIEELEPHDAARMGGMGFCDVFAIQVPAPDTHSVYRMVAWRAARHEPAPGLIHRLDQARELIKISLLRDHNDRLLDHSATHDPLTKLPNRVGLERRFEQLTSEPEGCSMIYLDLDGFKPINDEHGHAVGDRVLGVVAERLRRAVRSRDLVARVGGDEFAVLIPGSGTDVGRPERIAERILAVLRQPIVVGTITVTISASAGIARSVLSSNLLELAEQADVAMYAAKRAGGDRYRSGPQVQAA